MGACRGKAFRGSIGRWASAWAACALLAVTSIANAQSAAPSPSAETAGVEIWRGAPVPIQPLVPAIPASTAEEPGTATPRHEPDPSILPVTECVPGTSLLVPLPLQPAPKESAALAPRAPAPAKEPQTGKQAPTAPERSAEREDAAESRSQHEAAQNDFFYKLALMQIGGIVAALTLAPLVLAAVIVFVLRRHNSRSGPLFRVEIVNVTGMRLVATDYESDAVGGRLRSNRRGLDTEPHGEESTAQRFDLGPTYEEERLMKEKALRQQDQGLLKRIFDDNLQLRAQMQDVHDVAVSDCRKI
jgi:hypothetical protein